MCRFLQTVFLLVCVSYTSLGQDLSEFSDEYMVQRMLERYTETYGGMRDANRLSSIRIEGVQIQGNATYQFLIHKKRPSSIRYQLERGDTVLTFIFNGSQGWLQTKQGADLSAEELSGAQLKMLKKEARFDSPLYRHLENPDTRIRMVGREQVGGIYAYVLRVEEPGSPPSLYFLHPETSYLMRVDQMDDQGKVVFQTIYRDYEEVSGFPFAHEVENRVQGETISLSRVESISVNPGLLSFYFENPEN